MRIFYRILQVYARKKSEINIDLHFHSRDNQPMNDVILDADSASYNDPIMDRLEAAKRTTSGGGEYWMAREIQNIIGYAKWENFKYAAERIKAVCYGKT